ncbi:MAG: sugar ABC transporter permease [Chloroflexi bacterium]|nr:sugar ABC transporter permease [Chloroflexota bacterium]
MGISLKWTRVARTQPRQGLRAGLRSMSPAQRREARWGLIFISPWLIGFTCFYLMPMIASLIFSTYSFKLSAPGDAHFVGLANWKRMLFHDSNVWEGLRVTFTFGLISLFIGMVSAFLLAVLLNSKHLLARNVFRTLFYAPTMVPLIAAIVIWSRVLNPQTGWINKLIDLFGIHAVGVTGLRWLDDPKLIYFAYTFIGLWGIGNAVLINLAGLQGVPTELYEAAEIDGASWLKRLWKITIPMVSPIIFYNLILNVVGLLQYFIVPWVLNQGSGYPEGTTRFYMVYFYKQAFTFQNMGYGAALAWLMFIVALIITTVLFTTGRSWVYYSSEER